MWLPARLPCRGYSKLSGIITAKTGGFYRRALSRQNAREGARALGNAVRAGARRDYRAAAALLEDLIAEYEAPPEAFLFLGRALHAQKNYSRALAVLNDYIALKPRSPAGYFFAGRTCLALGFFPRAVHFLEEALRRNEETPRAETQKRFFGLCTALLGVAYLKSRRSRAAVDTLQQAVEATPENRRVYRAYLNALFIRGVRLCRAEEWELGSQMLRFVLDNGGETGLKAGPLLRLELGRSYRELGRLEDALENYSAALEFFPEDPMIRWYHSSVLMELGQNEEALEDIGKIRALGVELPELPWNGELVDRYMILSFMRGGAYRRAADACRDWIKKRGASPAIHALYAEAHRNMKAWDAAENHLKRALELDGESLELWYSLAFCGWESRRLSTLKKALYRARDLGGDSGLLSRLSILYESETGKNPRRVLSLLQKAVHSFGPETELMYALGKCYLRLGFLEEAAGWFSKTISLRPDHEESWLGMVAVREAFFGEEPSGNRDALERAYRDYLERWPGNLAMRRDEALFLVRICEYEKAAAKLEELLAWDPANPALRRILAYSYRKSGRCRDAALFLKALLKERPGDLRLLLEYAGCLERSGGVEQARAILEKAKACFTESPEIPTALGLLAYREGRPERAFELLLEAVSRNRDDPRPYRWMALIAKSKGDREGAERYRREYERAMGSGLEKR